MRQGPSSRRRLGAILVVAACVLIEPRSSGAQEPLLTDPNGTPSRGETLPPAKSSTAPPPVASPPTFIGPGGPPVAFPSPAPLLGQPVDSPIPFQQAPGVLIVPVSPRRIAGYSATTGGWRTYEPPKTMQVSPVAGEKIVAFVSLGPEVTHLVCFSGPHGNFHPIGIPPHPGPIEPRLTSCLAWFELRDKIWAYSAVTNSWGEIPLRNEGYEINHDDELLSVITEQKLHVFSAKSGRWDSLELNQR